MPVLGFGAVTLGREVGEDASYKLLDRAWELGFRIFDTAESYGAGCSEILLGKWIRSRGVRKDVEVHTKVSTDFSAPGIGEALSRSLHRLQLDFVDCYYLHSVPSHLEPALRALTGARTSGAVRRIGVCNASLGALTAAHNIAEPLDVCQIIYNLAHPAAGDDVIPWCDAHGIDAVAYSPLGAGFLTGKYGLSGELTLRGTRFDVVPGHRDVYFRPECFEALHRLTLAHEETGLPHHRLALSWVLSRQDLSVVLIGATRPEHLENAVATLSTPVDGGILARLKPAVAHKEQEAP